MQGTKVKIASQQDLRLFREERLAPRDPVAKGGMETAYTYDDTVVLLLRPMGWGEERQKTERQAFVHALWVLAPCPDLKAPWSPKHGKIHTYPLSDGENRACKRPCARLNFDKLKVPAGCIELLTQLTLRPCACYRKHQKCLRHDHTLLKLIQTTCGCRCYISG